MGKRQNNQTISNKEAEAFLKGIHRPSMGTMIGTFIMNVLGWTIMLGLMLLLLLLIFKGITWTLGV